MPVIKYIYTMETKSPMILCFTAILNVAFGDEATASAYVSVWPSHFKSTFKHAV